MLRKKLLKSSNKQPIKKNNRRTRNRIRKLSFLLIPLSIILSGICIWLILILLNLIHKPLYISPLTDRILHVSNHQDQFKYDLQAALQDKKIFYSNLKQTSSNFYEIRLANSEIAIVSSQKDLNTQISSLQYILSRLTMEGKQFSRLDLSFDKPVIVLK